MFYNPPTISITSHRGGAGYAPENSFGGFKRTLKVGIAEWVDFDVQRSKDGALIIFHDVKLGRTTNIGEVFPERSNESVSDFTLAELQQLDNGSWFRPGNFKGEAIPTLSEALDLLASQVGITFELKHPRLYPGIEEDVVDMIRRHGLEKSSALRVSSFEHDSLTRFHTALPTVPISGAFRNAEELRSSTILDILSGVSFAPRYTSELLALSNDFGLPVGTGMNSPQRMRQALEDGLFRLSTDYPDVLYRVHNGKKPFRQQPTIVVEDVIVDHKSMSKSAVLRNASLHTVDVEGWYLWDGCVSTAIEENKARIDPNEAMRVDLAKPRAVNNSSIQALAVHDRTDELRDLAEYWAVPHPDSRRI